MKFPCAELRMLYIYNNSLSSLPSSPGRFCLLLVVIFLLVDFAIHAIMTIFLNHEYVFLGIYQCLCTCLCVYIRGSQPYENWKQTSKVFYILRC